MKILQSLKPALVTASASPRSAPQTPQAAALKPRLSIDPAWTEKCAAQSRRGRLDPGPNQLRLERESAPKSLAVKNCRRWLGRFKLEVVR